MPSTKKNILSDDQINSRLHCLKSAAVGIEAELQNLINASGKIWYTKNEIMEKYLQLNKDIQAMSLYLSKNNTIPGFLIYSITNALQINDSVDKNLKLHYWNDTSLEVARQAITYYVINRLDKVVCRDRFLNIPFFK
jgi:hypothetical protein